MWEQDAENIGLGISELVLGVGAATGVDADGAELVGIVEVPSQPQLMRRFLPRQPEPKSLCWL